MNPMIPLQSTAARHQMTSICTCDHQRSSCPPALNEVESEHSPRPTPEHWRLDRGNNWFILRLLFKVLCAIGHGHANIDNIWDLMHEDKFTDHKDRLASRYSSLAVIVSVQFPFFPLFSEKSAVSVKITKELESYGLGRSAFRDNGDICDHRTTQTRHV
ncbi:hypothetical protein K435DRAFT_25890 [Dendrothele bispora CBS 962.96]|uniref:Uncharacterized protein n=1 Tax=Dendrothele bispora (strain CBS 962.96) TaxID=1314807 RepID=A0A4S8MUB1_DENBC|nr:hypothetical protein K435DRAFT_25890 [Dendrothele bispora CBS 962.96]